MRNIKDTVADVGDVVRINHRLDDIVTPILERGYDGQCNEWVYYYKGSDGKVKFTSRHFIFPPNQVSVDIVFNNTELRIYGEVNKSNRFDFHKIIWNGTDVLDLWVNAFHNYIEEIEMIVLRKLNK